ncbi:hypothetical protein PTE30175_01627 [Pandoraea terrae]|uniref:Tlde1 domain-containing protein n=1 Tax=Pandoraea terrae TaxID=1537710 RepID=A0A5E4TYU8_9BURK|nr:hypothetical protein PTE30175_01627 [Pandoraea terrae]
MALYGKFVVNNETLAPLVINGVGTYLAFSGDGAYRNRGGCTALASRGPIPAGKYWIVDRPAGGNLSRASQWMKDLSISALKRFVDHRE